jgi:hypothetical protein
MTLMVILTEVASNLRHCGAFFIPLKDRIKYRRFVQEINESYGGEPFFFASSIADKKRYCAIFTGLGSRPFKILRDFHWLRLATLQDIARFKLS